MEIVVQNADGIDLVEPHGRIDSTSATAFGDQLEKVLSASEPCVVVDLKNVVYVSSAGFRALLIARKQVDQSSGKLILCGLSSEVRRTFELGAFTELFTICGTRDEAISKAR